MLLIVKFLRDLASQENISVTFIGLRVCRGLEQHIYFSVGIISASAVP
jgi:hypothetical protein